MSNFKAGWSDFDKNFDAHRSSWDCDHTISDVFYTLGGILCAVIIEILNLAIGFNPLAKSNEPPTPAIRGTRLIYSTIFLIPLVTFFSLRVTPACGDVNWTLVFFVNVIPLVIGATAWLRALVDCILVRFGKSLPYPSQGYPMKGNFGWPSFAPLYMVYLMIATPVAVLVASGRAKEVESIETGLEERERLVHGNDEDELESEGRENPPPYRPNSEEAERLGGWPAGLAKTSD